MGKNMAAELFVPPSKALDANANPYAGAKWFFYLTGTTTPQSVFTTAVRDVPHANPVVADSTGKFANIYFDPAVTYRAVLKNLDETVTLHDIDPVSSGTLASLAASGGAALVGFLQRGTGAVARTLEARAKDSANLLDFIPVTEHAAILAKTSTYDCSAAIAAAHLAHDHVVVTEGRYVIGAMVELGLGNIGARGIECRAGAEFTRLDTGITTPMFWLKADSCFLIGAGVGACQITTAARCPDGIVLIGHRDMATSHANMFNCVLSGFKITGPINYGQTTGNPDVGIKFCNPQLGGLASYFHYVSNIRLQAVNTAISLIGFANGNNIRNIEGWYIGNATLATRREFIYIQGAQENQIETFFLHFSPGSTCVRLEDFDNTAVGGGFDHVSVYNRIVGLTEQDPTPSGGKGVVMNANFTGSVNTIYLDDNCPTSDVSLAAKLANDVTLNSEMNINRNVFIYGDASLGETTFRNNLAVVGNSTFAAATLHNSGIQVQTGANKRLGTATLVTGTVTVANTSVTANTRIMLSRETTGGTTGDLSSTRINATSFTINSSSATDTSTVAWMLVEGY